MPHENFVSTEWLAARLGEPDLGIIDASWHLPPTGRNGDAGIPRRRIFPARCSSTST